MQAAPPPPAAVAAALAWTADPTARLAAAFFDAGCLRLLAARNLTSDYVPWVRSIANGGSKLVPGADLSRVRLDWVADRTCRVSYTGPQADGLFATMSQFKPNEAGENCTDLISDRSHVSLTCPAGRFNGYSFDAQRLGSGAISNFVVAMTYNAPAISPQPADMAVAPKPH